MLNSKRLAIRFCKMRFDKGCHLGLGDIRISIAQQDEIVDAMAVLEDQIAMLEEALGREATELALEVFGD